MVEHFPGYLREIGKMKDNKLIARFRCGNELRGIVWRKKEERKCRVCRGEENVMHILEECQKTKTGRRK